MRDRDEEGWVRIDAVEREAVAAGWIEPLGNAVDERRRWRACDLASLIEGCFHEIVEPDRLDDDSARPWVERLRGMFVISALDEADEPREPERRYWLREGGHRVGTILLGVSRFRGPWLFVRSLYTLTAARGRGTAGRCLAALADIAARHDLHGLRLATFWTWHRSVRFYLARDFWVYMWKHDIQLVLVPALPRRRFTIEGDAAYFDVAQGDDHRRLWTARRADDRLVLEQSFADGEIDGELDRLAVGTFAILLALAGWPLVRSEDHWAKRYHWADAGEPEGLAYKIGVFERVAREHGFAVETATVPGLDRWRAWADGEHYGEGAQLQRDLDMILRAREWTIETSLRDQLRHLERYFGLEHLLRLAVTAASLDEWLTKANELLAQER